MDRSMLRITGIYFCGFVAAAALATVNGAHAASLSVSPLRVDVKAPGKTAQVTLRNESRRTINVQVRIFRWRQKGGKDDFVQTRDVVASPPVARMTAGNQFQVRIVRVSGRPVRGQDAYRLVIDELPSAPPARRTGITVAIRYILPVFFTAPDARPGRVRWSVRGRGGSRVLVARNSGDLSVRLSELRVGGVRIKRGLAGYVLGRSVRHFPMPSRAPSRGSITAQTTEGSIRARISR